MKTSLKASLAHALHVAKTEIEYFTTNKAVRLWPVFVLYSVTAIMIAKLAIIVL